MELTARIAADRVAAYIRWSTDDQAQGTTLEVQRAACEHYMCSQGYSFNPGLVFVDDGYSGATLDRPAMAALRQAARRGEVECVVVYTLDRLSRSVVDTVELVLREWEGRCFLRCVQQPIDTSHPSGKMFFYMLASYAEFEREMIRMRTLGGKQRRARQGANAGWRYNYGFTKGSAPGSYAIQPREAEIVRKLYRDYLSGRGFKELAAGLNAVGVPSPAGKSWSANGVKFILSNPIYAGRLEYGKERRLHRDGRITYLRSPVPRHAAVDGAVPALVDAAIWLSVQERRRERAARSPRTLGRRGYLLSGVAGCKGCGRPLAGVAAGKLRFYRCTGRREFGAAYCRSAAVRADRLERLVLGQLKPELARESLALALETLVSRQREETRTAAAQAGLISAELTLLRQAQRRLDHAFDMGGLESTVYSRRSLDLAAKIDWLQGQVEEAEAQAARLQGLAAPVEYPEGLALSLDPWDQLEPLEHKALIRDAVADLKVFQESTGKGRRRNPHPLQVELTLWI